MYHSLKDDSCMSVLFSFCFCFIFLVFLYVSLLFSTLRYTFILLELLFHALFLPPDTFFFFPILCFCVAEVLLSVVLYH